MSERAQPFWCPYCGEGEIRPANDERTYHCALCDRRWRLEFAGLGTGEPAGDEAAT